MLFRDILDTYIDGRNDIITVYCRFVYDIQVLVHHFLAVCDTVRTAQNGIVSQFQTVFALEPYPDTCLPMFAWLMNRTVFALVESQFVEASLILAQVEYG